MSTITGIDEIKLTIDGVTFRYETETHHGVMQHKIFERGQEIVSIITSQPFREFVAENIQYELLRTWGSTETVVSTTVEGRAADISCVEADGFIGSARFNGSDEYNDRLFNHAVQCREKNYMHAVRNQVWFQVERERDRNRVRAIQKEKENNDGG